MKKVWKNWQQGYIKCELSWGVLKLDIINLKKGLR